MWSRTTREIQNPARLRKSLQPCRDVDRIAEQIAALHDDVADVDADPKPHLLGGWSIRILLGDRFLNLDGTLHGIHSTGEVGDDTIASRAEDPAPMRGDQPISDDPICGERAKRANLVDAHEAAVALDIGGEDCGELSFDRVGFQGSGTSSINYSPIRQEIRGL
jgi:hypothetical protein